MLDHHLQHLHIQSLRNLVDCPLVLSPGGNFFFGANGAGKTSVLEAAHFLSTGRSFRSGPARSLITHNEDFCRVVGRVVTGHADIPMGIERQRSGELTARVAGSPARSLSDLAERLPVVLLDTESLALVTGSPEGRRRFLDAAVFHVEQSFLDAWRRYQRALRQRNAGLRHGTIAADAAWRDELAIAGEALTASRERVMAQLSSELGHIIARLSPQLSDASLTLRRGWEAGSTLADAMLAMIDSDRRQGFTQSGPHRADIRVLVDGRPAADVLSRGQLKVLVSALRLAQGKVVANRRESRPIYLIDDLVAELDAHHARRICQMLAENRAQVLMTSVDAGELLTWWGDSPKKVFHVEQGRISTEEPEVN